MKRLFILLTVVVAVSGCASQQSMKFIGKPPPSVCIAEHKAVKPGVLKVIRETFEANGVLTWRINGTYVKRGTMWHPSVLPEQRKNCNAIVFYVANWTWDIAVYMHFANIWVTNPEMTHKVAYAVYQGGQSLNLDKFINAEKKIRELVNSLFW